LIAALICAWITIAFTTNSQALAFGVTTTNYITYPLTLKMAKLTTKMTKTALKKAKGQTKLMDQFLKEREQAAEKKVREDKAKKAVKASNDEEGSGGSKGGPEGQEEC